MKFQYGRNVTLFFFLFEWKFLLAVLKYDSFYRGHALCSVFCLVGNHRRGLTSILRLYCIDRYLKASLFLGDQQTDDENLYHCWYNPAGGSFEILRGMIPFIICSPFGIFFCLLVFHWQKLDTLSTVFISRFYGLSNRNIYRCT